MSFVPDVQTYPPVPPVGGSSGPSFLQGFILGQISIVILIGAFIKFFIFGEAPSVHESSSSSNRSLSTLSPTHKRTISFTSPQPRDTHRSRSNHHASSSSSTSHHNIIRPPPTLTPATILSKTYYNVAAHQPESLDWFNVLIAQTLAQMRRDAFADDAVLTSLTTLLNGPQKPDFIERIAVTEISLGEDFPIFSNCRVHPVRDDGSDGWGSTAGGGSGGSGSTAAGGTGAGASSGGGGRLQARMDVDLSDFITLGIETSVVLNYPRPRTAVLPVALSVSVVRFSGTLGISFLPASAPTAAAAASASANDHGSPPSPSPFRRGGSGGGGSGYQQQQQRPSQQQPPPPPPKRTPTTLAFAFEPNYTLSLSTRSLLGARSRLQDVPKIAQLVESRLRTWFEERVVNPRMQQVVVPSLWPRMKNVVEGEGGPGTAKDGVPTAGVGGVGERDLREEARREVEEEERERERARAVAREEWEGLRWRGQGQGRGQGRERGGFDMPGSMPGSLVL